jgi:2-hydroxycyclohexanecarboxyl-CoA dehydrogenase
LALLKGGDKQAMRGLEKKVAIVTGGGGAIGRAICQRFGEEGSVVGVFDINEEAAGGTAVAEPPAASISAAVRRRRTGSI